MLTEYHGPTLMVQTRDRSEHGPEGHQVAHYVTIFDLECCSPYVNSAVVKIRNRNTTFMHAPIHFKFGSIMLIFKDEKKNNWKTKNIELKTRIRYKPH